MGNSILDRIAKERAKKLEKVNELMAPIVAASDYSEEFNHPAEPPKGSLAYGEPESGFINPPEGAQRPTSAEGASQGAQVANNTIVSQGLESLKAEDTERTGEVDERAQLKAECVRLGLCEPNSRLRVDALRKLLDGDKVTVATSRVSFSSEESTPSEPIPSLQRKPKPIIILYVDCLPNTAVVDAHTMVGSLLPDVLKQVGEAHVKHVDFGKGTAALAVALEKHLEGKVLDQVFVDSRTVENDVLAVLVRSADVVVRGLR